MFWIHVFQTPPLYLFLCFFNPLFYIYIHILFLFFSYSSIFIPAFQTDPLMKNMPQDKVEKKKGKRTQTCTDFLSHTLQWFHFHSISQSASPTVCPLVLGGAESTAHAVQCMMPSSAGPFMLALRIHTVSICRPLIWCARALFF
jgi:hypothetical protein